MTRRGVMTVMQLERLRRRRRSRTRARRGLAILQQQSIDYRDKITAMADVAIKQLRSSGQSSVPVDSLESFFSERGSARRDIDATLRYLESRGEVRVDATRSVVSLGK